LIRSRHQFLAGQDRAGARLFDKGKHPARELTQFAHGQDRARALPGVERHDQEAIRQHAIAAMNITQQAKLALVQSDASRGREQGSTACWRGLRKFINVRDLDIDLIDRINPFEAAYAGTGNSDGREITAPGAGQHCRQEGEHLRGRSPRELAKRALQFKNGVAPAGHQLSRRMGKAHGEGVAALARYRAQAKAAQVQGESGNG
jgi:hypothetical protein